MCGWILVIDGAGTGLPAEQLGSAVAALRHRGPDDEGMFSEAGVAMGFARLSIIDLSSGGHQPMHSADGHHVLLFNGEIYNYRELRTELESVGHLFHSRSDSEVLLAAYRQWGPDCVRRLNGMFAFVVYDRVQRRLFGARDRLGEKPFYCWNDDRWTVLASEPRSIAATGLMALEPDWSRVASFLARGALDHEAGTCLRGVHQLAAAHTVTFRLGHERQVRRYWCPELAPSADGDGILGRAEDRSDARWVEQLSSLVTDSVRLRLRSDVPVGFTLSGGIDSSLLICEAAAQAPGALNAFSFDDPLHDEQRQILPTLQQTGAIAHTLRADALDLAALLPKVVAANGEPVQSWSAVANYALFGLARESGVKVVLGGQGADEVFAGYRSFEADRWALMALRQHWPALWSDIVASSRLHGSAPWPAFVQACGRALRMVLGNTRPYRRLRVARQRPPARHAFVSRAFFTEHPDAGSVDVAGWRTLADSQQYAMSESPLPLFLRVEDRVSMAHSVEARLPYMDHRLVELGLRLPERLKYEHGLNKVALRRAAAPRVPAAVVHNVRKLGFPIGLRQRTAQQLQALCRELAATRAFRERGLYDMAAVSRMLSAPPVAGDSPVLFDLAQTELWLSGLDTARTGAR